MGEVKQQLLEPSFNRAVKVFASDDRITSDGGRRPHIFRGVNSLASAKLVCIPARQVTSATAGASWVVESPAS